MASKKKNNKKNKHLNSQNEQDLLKKNRESVYDEESEEETVPLLEEDPEGEIPIFDFADVEAAPAVEEGEDQNGRDPDDEPDLPVFSVKDDEAELPDFVLDTPDVLLDDDLPDFLQFPSHKPTGPVQEEQSSDHLNLDDIPVTAGNLNVNVTPVPRISKKQEQSAHSEHLNLDDIPEQESSAPKSHSSTKEQPASEEDSVHTIQKEIMQDEWIREEKMHIPRREVNPVLRSMVVFSCLIAAVGLLVSTVHVLTRSSIEDHEKNAFDRSFARLFPESSALREYTTEDGTTVYLAVHEGRIIGYCLEDGGKLVGYDENGQPLLNSAPAFALDLQQIAIDLGLESSAETEAQEPNANDENGREEIVIGEAVEEDHESEGETEEIPTETVETVETVETEEATETEESVELETEPAEPELPVITDPVEPEPELPDVPDVEETEPETVPETEPETTPETWWTPETAPETTPETAAPETEPETETNAENPPADTDMSESSETDPAVTETEEQNPIDPDPETEEPETEAPETEAPPEPETEETKRDIFGSGNGLFG